MTLWYVYILDKEHYAGKTHRLQDRLKEHRNLGKDCSTFQVVGTYTTEKEAREHESKLHLQGYKGFWDYSQPVNQLTKNRLLIKTWPSATIAAKSLGLNYYAIHNCLKGISKTSSGYRWEYSR